MKYTKTMPNLLHPSEYINAASAMQERYNRLAALAQEIEGRQPLWSVKQSTARAWRGSLADEFHRQLGDWFTESSRVHEAVRAAADAARAVENQLLALAREAEAELAREAALAERQAEEARLRRVAAGRAA